VTKHAVTRPHVTDAAALGTGESEAAAKARATGEVQASRGWVGARLQYGEEEESSMGGEWGDEAGTLRGPNMQGRQYGLNLDTDRRQRMGLTGQARWPGTRAAPGWR